MNFGMIAKLEDWLFNLPEGPLTKYIIAKWVYWAENFVVRGRKEKQNIILC